MLSKEELPLLTVRDGLISSPGPTGKAVALNGDLGLSEAGR